MTHAVFRLTLLLAVALVALGCAAARDGSAPTWSSPYEEPDKGITARPLPKEAAAKALQKALAAEPGPGGLRRVWMCPPDEDTAKDTCYRSQVLTALLEDIGRRTRQGDGVLVVAPAPGPSLNAQPAECFNQMDLLYFKLVPKNLFDASILTPLIKSPCYHVGFQFTLSDCDCLSNIADAIGELTSQAQSWGKILLILDTRRFGTWEVGPPDQGGVNVNAPGFDIIYAIVPRPKGFDTASAMDFVPEAKNDPGASGIHLGNAPPISYNINQATPQAAPQIKAQGKTQTKAQVQSKNKTQAKSKSPAKAKPAAKGKAPQPAKKAAPTTQPSGNGT